MRKGNFMEVELKIAEKSDEKILAKLLCEALDPPSTNVWRKHLLHFGFVRRKILRFFSKAMLEHWDKLKFWLILVNNNVVGFMTVTWKEASERNNRIATIHEIYLPKEFRGQNIENHVVKFIINFCVENELRLGYGVKAEWNLEGEL